MTDLKRVIRYLTGHPWAILPSKLEEIAAVLRDRLGTDREAVKARIEAFRAEQAADPQAAARGKSRTTVGDIGIVPIIGVMARRADFMMEWSGGTSTARTAAVIGEMAADPAIKGILLDIDSPGGSVDGTPELAVAVAEAAKVKPVFANANGMAASAAYWVGSQATEFSASLSAMVGSIGVLSLHIDHSQNLEREGFRPTIIRSGAHKAEWNPYEPLSAEAREEGQRVSDAIYKQFVTAVAAGRGASQAKVRDTFGEGRVVLAEDALRKGMVDRVETIGQTLSRLVRRVARADGRSQRAELRTVRNFEAFLREAGDFSRAEAKAIASSGFKAALDDAAADEDAPREGAPAETVAEDVELGQLLRSYVETVDISNPKEG